MVARGSVRQGEHRGSDHAHRDVGRVTGEGAVRVRQVIGDLRARDLRQNARRLVAGTTEVACRRPAIVLGVAVTLGLVMLIVRFRSARRTAATPAPSASRSDDASLTMSVDTADATDTGRPLAPAPSIAARVLDAPDPPDALVLASDAGASAAAVPDAPLAPPLSDDDAPVRVTDTGGHLTPVVVSESTLFHAMAPDADHSDRRTGGIRCRCGTPRERASTCSRSTKYLIAGLPRTHSVSVTGTCPCRQRYRRRRR